MASLLAAVALIASGWQAGAAMPDSRSEVAATPYLNGIAIVAGFAGSCVNSKRVDVYAPGTNTWRRLRDLPIALNHAAATGYRGKLYVTGGYGDDPHFSRATFVFDGKRWTQLRSMPAGRGAPGSAVVNGKWYVVGGVAPNGLATTTLVFDFKTGKWSSVPGPTPREHLAVTAMGGKVYALAGRTGGFDSNLDTLEAFTPRTKSWQRLAPVPSTRGGTGAAAVGRTIVSVGGEEQAGTIASVYAYDTSTNAWTKLDDLPTPRHGLGVTAFKGRVYVIGGGPTPGCSSSTANESLQIG